MGSTRLPVGILDSASSERLQQLRCPNAHGRRIRQCDRLGYLNLDSEIGTIVSSRLLVESHPLNGSGGSHRQDEMAAAQDLKRTIEDDETFHPHRHLDGMCHPCRSHLLYHQAWKGMRRVCPERSSGSWATYPEQGYLMVCRRLTTESRPLDSQYRA